MLEGEGEVIKDPAGTDIPPGGGGEGWEGGANSKNHLGQRLIFS